VISLAHFLAIARAMTRRRFTFWIGFGLFSLSNKLGIGGLDAIAAAAMEGAAQTGKRPALPEHWTTAGDKEWSWFERENHINGEWRLTGTTRPVNNDTGEPKPDSIAYLDDHLVPTDMRSDAEEEPELATSANDGLVAEHPEDDETSEPQQLPTTTGRARHGRPPSKWLRSLDADELRIWLTTVKVPEAGVSGMTYWEHLTRDHSFDAVNIEGLTEAEQAKLHAAAHFGY
jgi:hypothetical protein